MPHLGSNNEVVEVKSGYARNYLLPRKIAIYASQTAIKNLDSNKEKLARYHQSITDVAKNVKHILETASTEQKIILQEVADTTGTLYAKLTGQQLLKKLQQLLTISFPETSFMIDFRKIVQIGEYPLKINLYDNNIAEITVKVVAS